MTRFALLLRNTRRGGCSGLSPKPCQDEWQSEAEIFSERGFGAQERDVSTSIILFLLLPRSLFQQSFEKMVKSTEIVVALNLKSSGPRGEAMANDSNESHASGTEIHN